MSGSTRRLRKLRALVLRQEPVCWLGLDGCTRIATTIDHVLPVSTHPGLKEVRANMRGACAHCNKSRGRTPVSALPRPTNRSRALDFLG